MKATQKKKTVNETTRWNIVSGDVVRVIQGPQTGQEGKVLDILREKNRILVEGVNMVRRPLTLTFFSLLLSIFLCCLLSEKKNCETNKWFSRENNLKAMHGSFFKCYAY